MLRAAVLLILSATAVASHMSAEVARNPKVQVVDISKADALPKRVRIRIAMTPYAAVMTKGSDGASTSTYQPERVMHHTLRSRLGDSNEFYFADWHVKTYAIDYQPTQKKYTVRLNFFRTHGTDDTSEEAVGSVDVTGFLKEDDQKVYNLITDTSAIFKNIQNQPVLKLKVGMTAEEKTPNVARMHSER
jgi:hypothetical protein